MNNIITNKISNLVLTQEIDSTKTAQLMYIDFKPEDTGKRNIKEIRDLKVGELIHNEDNSEKIKILENDNTYLPEGEIHTIPSTPRVFTSNLTKSIKLLDEDSIPNINDHLQTLILKEIYKSSDDSRKNVSVLKTRFDLNISGDDDVNKGRRLFSRILNDSNYIAVESRIGTANTIIMNSEYAYFLAHSLNQTIHKNADELTIDRFDIIIDDTLKDRIVVLRSQSDVYQIPNNIFLLYHYDESVKKLFYSIEKLGNCDCNYIQINVTGFDS